MNQQAATLTLGNDVTSRGSNRAFARHFGEMLLAMLLGMAVLGGLAQLAFALFGGSLSDQPGGLRIMLMGVYMTVPMGLRMSHRGLHTHPHEPVRIVDRLPAIAEQLSVDRVAAEDGVVVEFEPAKGVFGAEVDVPLAVEEIGHL